MICDFYLPDHDLYIEFWGGGTQDYETRKRDKLSLYKRLGLKLVSPSNSDIEQLEYRLKQKLRSFGVRV